MGLFEFYASLVCMMSSKMLKATYRDPISNRQNKGFRRWLT